MSNTVHDLKMPSFGADMAEGTLVEWQVKEGEQIKRGHVIAEIETDKGIIDLDIFEDAVIEKLLIKEGELVSVGTPIARLRSLRDAPVAPELNSSEAEVITETGTAADKIITDPTAKKEPEEQDFIKATPAARAFADKHKISLHSVKALNSDKAIITLEMVEALQRETALTAQQSITETIEQRAQSKAGFDKDAMRQSISDTVTRSKREIPHYYLSLRLDITELEHYLHQYNAGVAPEQRILLAAPLLCAVAQTLMKNPQLNGVYTHNQFSPGDTVNLANAVNLRGGGLVMPVIRDAQKLTPIAMMEELKGQVSRARNASLRISELSGGSFTVTNIGERGAEQMFAVIYPPQVAIIALGTPHQEAMVIDGGIHVRSVIEATLAADHRISDGHTGARLLYQLNQKLQKPEELWTIKS
jgi:pyruvate dehydrogenase E2 component (dihydrolipoamide acetyltransferase)